MSIWVNKDTKVLVQGITGKAARYHTEQMLKYGTKIVAGTSPNTTVKDIEGVPVFQSVLKAKEATGCHVSIIYVPAPYAADAIIEAVDASMDMVICITEHIPVNDMLKVKHYMKGKKTRLLGPNCPGIITSDETKIGIMPGHIHRKGDIGIVSRSGTLTYEAVNALTQSGYGQTTAVGIGGDPVNGTDFIDVLDAFNKDDQTKAVVMIGEIGGDAEELAAEWLSKNMKKPVVAFISGVSAPKGKRMGHAGAIVTGSSGSASSKIETLKKHGIKVASKLSEITPLLEGAMK